MRITRKLGKNIRTNMRMNVYVGAVLAMYVEDEFHFLCMCPTYFNERLDLIKACTEFNMSLDNDCEESMRINCDDPVFEKGQEIMNGKE